MSGVIETGEIGALLGMDSEEVPSAKYALSGGEHNYCQIVRTPGRADEKNYLLDQHKRAIETLLEHGARHAVVDRGIGERTFTGGRQFFQRSGVGRIAYYRGRGLVWREWDTKIARQIIIPLVPQGEWLSDVGLIPEGLSVVRTGENNEA